MLLVGSQALKFYTNLDREPKDWDFIGTIEEIEAFIEARKDRVKSTYPESDGKKIVLFLEDELPIEFEVAWPGTTAESLLEDFTPPTQPLYWQKYNSFFDAPSLNILYELKLSHRFLKNSPHFLKTMRDIQFMRTLGAKVEHPDWLKAREKETYNYSHPKLNVMKDQFFKKEDGIDYIYDHDSIHVAIARGERPAYTYFKPENSEVMCDKNMFFAASEEIRLHSVVEEATVLALERSQIPYKDKVSPRWSFEHALMKVCTSITSGWFREFCWENFDKALALYDEKYVDKFWNAVEKGIVQKVKKE